jgi:hypothetical protein
MGKFNMVRMTDREDEMKIIVLEDLPPELRLSIYELGILTRAQIICEKADKLLRPGGDSEADPTIYAYASGDLSQVILETIKER